jgi:hypothetical protein
MTMRAASKRCFFEKTQQKTFVPWRHPSWPGLSRPTTPMRQLKEA